MYIAQTAPVHHPNPSPTSLIPRTPTHPQSPTPSDADHQQEDRNNHEHAATPLATPEGDADEVDLDASVEDMDRADDRSTEYDSDDLRLMRDMDRSVGSRTPMSDEEDMDEE
jgi:hypothetical protein